MHRVVLSSIVMLAMLFLMAARMHAAEPLDAESIKAALRTATPEEEAFIDRTVAMVGKGTLPRDLFESTFLWARKKPRLKFQYFQRGLILRAEQQGIRL